MTRKTVTRHDKKNGRDPTPPTLLLSDRFTRGAGSVQIGDRF